VICLSSFNFFYLAEFVLMYLPILHGLKLYVVLVDLGQRLSYSLWRHQTPVSLRPLCAVEPLVHTPDRVHSAGICGIGVVDDSVPEHEHTYPRPIAGVRRLVGSNCGRELGAWLRASVLCPSRGRRARCIRLVLLLLGEGDVEVEVGVATER